MLLDLWVILFVLAFIILIAGWKLKKLLFTLLSTILFFVLALQAFTLEFITSAGVTVVVQEPILVIFNWFMGFFSFVLTMLGLVEAVKTKNNKELAKRMGTELN